MKEGDIVLMQNYKKKNKFDPNYIPEPFKVMQSNDQGRSLLVERQSDGAVFNRHPDNLKIFSGKFKLPQPSCQLEEKDVLNEFHRQLVEVLLDDEYDDNEIDFSAENMEHQPEPHVYGVRI